MADRNGLASLETPADPRDQAPATKLVVGHRYLRDAAEYRHWHEILARGFTEWYGGTSALKKVETGRRHANARAMLFPDFTYQVRTAEGKAVAYFNTVPGYWSGDPQALQDLHYYTDALKVSRRRAAQLGRLYFWTVEVLNVPQLFERITRRFRESRLAGANCVVLVSIAVDPEYQRLQIPTMLITAARSTAKRLGLKYIVSPFRPSAYGSYKAERKAAHSSKLFEEYCSLKTEQGLPRDPWMRVLTRNGARFLRPEPRSYRVPGLIESFRRFQRTFKPESWYSPSADVWECGETPTWYVDPFRQQVLSVEPNIWGFMTV